MASDALRMAFAHCHTTTVNAVYHVVRVDGPVLVAACNQWTTLDAATEGPLAATHPGMRCNRPACRNRWAVQSQPDHDEETGQ